MNVSVLSQNAKPVANGGTNPVITLPTSTANLAGSGTDSDGTITAYNWVYASGPATAVLNTPNAASTSVSGLTSAGVYYFLFIVTDNRGAKDTANVNILVNAAAGVANSYTYRAITVDRTKVANTVQTDFPVLVNVTQLNLRTTANGGKVRNSAGHDIMFTTDSTGLNKLKWEIEKYVPATGELVAWVKMDVSPATDKVFYIQYGDPTISTFQGNVAETWNADFAAVYHFANGSSLNAN
ncbi:MAG: DUF2341 domain-containing protein, partial [Pedobacter sp.]